MEALSYYSNMGALNSDMNNILPNNPTSELPPELLLGCMSEVDNFAFPLDVCNNNIDQYLFDPNEFFHFNDENYNSDQLSSTQVFTDPSGHNDLSTAISSAEQFLLQQEFDQPDFHYPKRQKPDYEEINYFDNQYFNPDHVFHQLVPNYPDFQSQPPLPDFQSPPPVYSNGISCENSKKSLSAQSIAARQRRRKITEKTQELGKLIPGSQRMNTAEMFHAAFKYIKFLQSQVGILEFMGSYHQENNEEILQSEELSCLLESSMVQEKLYSTEKCIVPQKLVDELSSDDGISQSKPQVLEEIRQLVRT